MGKHGQRVSRSVMAAAVVAGMAGLGLAGPARAVAAASGPVSAAGSWGRAVEVPGLAALNKGGDAEVLSVSCGAAGRCAAGGYYTDSTGYAQQGFVAVERNGQ